VQLGRLPQFPPKTYESNFIYHDFLQFENSICDIRPFCRPLFCHSSFVKYTLSYISEAVMRLDYLILLKSPTLTLLAGSVLASTWLKTSSNKIFPNQVRFRCVSQTFIQGRRNRVRQGGAMKELRAMETYKKQKIVTNYYCFCASTTLTSKIVAEIVENHSEFYGCTNSCSKIVSNRSW